MSRCMHVFLWPGRSFVLGCPSAPARPPFPPSRARIYPLAVLASHGVRKKLPLPGISLPILQPDTTPHTPRCNSPLIRAPPHPDVDANLEFKADPEPHSLIYLSIPIPILCYLYLFIIFLSPFANRHLTIITAAVKRIDPSHTRHLFSPPPAPTQNTSKSSHCILIIYWHLRIHTFTFCWIARRPKPCAPLLSISTWKTTVNPLDTSPSFVTFCPFCVVLWFLTDYTSVFLRRTLPLPLRLAHALAPTRPKFIIFRASLPPRHTALGRRSHLIPSYSAIHSSLCFPTCRLFLSYLYRYPYPCVSLVLCPVSLSH